MNQKKEKKLVITTNVQIGVQNEMELEEILLSLDETKAIQQYWSSKKKRILFWTVLRWIVYSIGFVFIVPYVRIHLEAYLEMPILSFILMATFVVAVFLFLKWGDNKLFPKTIKGYTKKLTPLLERYRQILASNFIHLRAEKFGDLINLLFPNVAKDELEHDLFRGHDINNIIHITYCTFCKFDYLIIEQQLGKELSLFDYSWYLSLDVQVEKSIKLVCMYLNDKREVVIVLEGEGLENIHFQHLHLISKKLDYIELW